MTEIPDHNTGTLLESLDDIESVSGDTGYLSHRNCMLVEAKGATPYLKPRRYSPQKPIGPPSWKRMIHSYRRDKRRWMKHYHTRSMTETAFSTIKRTKPPTDLNKKRPPETRTHDQSNRLQHHSPNQKQTKRSIEIKPRTASKARFWAGKSREILGGPTRTEAKLRRSLASPFR